MAPSWAVTSEKVQAVVKRIIQVSKPRKLILFGSYARRQLRPHSDLDVLVVVRDEVRNPRQESVRIRQALRGIFMPMDILVVSEGRLKELAEVPGLIYQEAIRTGITVYEEEAA